MSAATMYNVKPGQIYIANDGSKCGHIVVNTTKYADAGDILTNAFTASEGFYKLNNRIDCFSLAMVRYHLVEQLPDWAMPLFNENGSW